MDLFDSCDVVICIAGSRSYNDYKDFSYWVGHYVAQFKDKRLCVVSGDASSGADAMAIRWCSENNIECVKMPADWDTHGKRAGFIRNAQMREVITHLLAFWDGISSGTAEMIEGSLDEGVDVATIIVTPDVVKDTPNRFSRRSYKNGKRTSTKSAFRRY